MILIDIILANAGIQHLTKVISVDSGSPLRYARNDVLENTMKTNGAKGEQP